ncbi:MAG: HTTM domain-containing protein [Crocinitomicaceae bacterium]|nr:HTTM domain-containing protein [Crocinitomicaceae bacterium]
MTRLVSSASLVTLRRLFALLTLCSTIRFIAYGWVETQILQPNWLFPFDGFEWLPRPNTEGAILLFTGMILGSCLMLFDKVVRLGAFIFFCCFTYVELLDKCNYLNHYYFVSLVAFLLILVPTRSDRPVVPLFMKLVFQGLLALVYFFAGLAKLQSDWLIEALPLSIWLPQHSSLPIIGPLLAERWVAYAFSWGGAAFDLIAPFALFSHKIRPWFYPILVVFHVLTWVLFPIGIFPWVMILSTTVFFRDVWHVSLWERLGLPLTKTADFDAMSHSRFGWQFAAMTVFFIFQVIFPWRYLAYPGNLFWHETGYRFGWRVMLMEKAGMATFFVNEGSGVEQIFELDEVLTPYQIKMTATQPDLLRQVARRIAAENEGEERVRAEVWVSMNGRRSQLFVDPFEDLSASINSWAPRHYVLPLDSVIRPAEWNRIREHVRNERGW